MNKPGVMIYFTMRPSRKLPMEDRLRLYDAMLDYGETGVVPDFGNGPLAVLWDYFQPKLDTDNQRYESIRAKRSQAGRLGGQASQSSRQPEGAPQAEQAEADEAAEANEAKEANEANEANTIQSNPVQSSTVQSNPVQLRESIAAKAPPAPKKRFVPPTQAEIEAYVREAKLAMDPQEFLDYYTANGWKVGSHAMKDWRAAARNWARKETQLPRQVPRPAPIVLAPLEDPYGAITY